MPTGIEPQTPEDWMRLVGIRPQSEIIMPRPVISEWTTNTVTINPLVPKQLGLDIEVSSMSINDHLFDAFKSSSVPDKVTKQSFSELRFDKKFRGSTKKFTLVVAKGYGYNNDKTRIRLKNKGELFKFDFILDENHLPEQAEELVRFIKTQFSLMEETLNNLEKNIKP